MPIFITFLRVPVLRLDKRSNINKISKYQNIIHIKTCACCVEFKFCFYVFNITESSMACQRSLSGDWCEFSWLILFSGVVVDAKENYFKKLRILACTHLREKYVRVFCLF